MDRRTFLKTVAQAAGAAGIAGVAGVAGTARAGSESTALTSTGAPDRLTLAAVGDCILARRVSEIRDPDFLALVELLHGVDCTWGNSEIVLADPQKLYPSPKGVDPHGIADPWAADELRALGLRLMGTANNHTLDYGYDGLFASLENLDRVGIAHAGAGADLAQAARPGSFDSGAGRISDVNCASTFAAYFPAGPAHPYVKGRPGINALHADATVQVDRALFARLQEVNAKIEELQGYREFDPLVDPPAPRPEDLANFDSTAIRAGDRTDYLVEGRKGDVERIVQAIRTARHGSRVVIASIHAHEAHTVLERPSPFLPPSPMPRSTPAPTSSWPPARTFCAVSRSIKGSRSSTPWGTSSSTTRPSASSPPRPWPPTAWTAGPSTPSPTRRRSATGSSGASGRASCPASPGRATG